VNWAIAREQYCAVDYEVFGRDQGSVRRASVSGCAGGTSRAAWLRRRPRGCSRAARPRARWASHGDYRSAC